jgi:hypothetical protein
VPLLPATVLTKWGTWLEAAFFTSNHFDGFRKVLEKQLENDSAISIKKCTDLFSQVSVQNDLIFLKSHFFVLIQTIKNVEKSNLPLIESVEMVQNIISSMQSITGIKGSEIKNKMLHLQQKNKGFKLMIQIV